LQEKSTLKTYKLTKQTNTVISLAELLITMISTMFGDYLLGALLIFCLSLLRFILKFSNGSFFLELIYLHANITCLLMPYIGYIYFSKSSALARLWVKSMPVTEDVYFGYMIPAIVCMGFAFFLLRKNSRDDETMINPMVSELKTNIQQIPTGSIIVLSIAGLIAHAIEPFLPDSLQQVNSFLYFSFYTSIFYIFYYTNFPYKKIFLSFAILFVIKDALSSGMFTIIAYMGGIFLILILAGKKISFTKRLLFLVIAFSFVGFLQLFKTNWRSATRRGNTDVSVVLATTAAKSNDNRVETVLFPLYLRMNQGFNIGLIMRRIPSNVDYLGGNYLALSFASAFVPRLLWPDKPMAGGQYNMKIYTGVEIKGWSTNVGPLGEAYGNFGVEGGCFYMIVFGLFIRLCYTGFLKICRKQPIFFVWMPVLFFQVIYVMETDSLQAFNSLAKGSVFLFMISKLLPLLFPKKKSHETGTHIQKAEPAVL
jgi:hypothetical protein